MYHPIHKTITSIALAALILSVSASLSHEHVAGQRIPALPAPLHARTAALPLFFEANKGQSASNVAFLARGSNSTLFVGERGLALESKQVVRDGGSMQGPLAHCRHPATAYSAVGSRTLRLTWQGVSTHSRIQGLGRLPGRVNYFIGNNPRLWHRDIPTYAQLAYRDVYPGIDLLLHSAPRHHIEYDWQVHARADARRIRVRVSGIGRVTIGRDGSLLSRTGSDIALQSRPIAYQLVKGVLRRIAVRYTTVGQNTFGFWLGAHDVSRPLTIDPVIRAGISLGALAYANSIAVDGSGSLYLTGDTYSDTFPGPSQVQRASHGGDTFVAKLNSAGTGLIYGTYLSGTVADVQSPPGTTGTVTPKDTSPAQEAHAIAVDGSGNAYVTGEVRADDFPTVNAVQSTFGGGVCPSQATGMVVLLTCYDAYVAKLNAQGDQLVYSTYLGGSENDEGYGIAVDRAGNAVVTGEVGSSQFPLKNPLDASRHGSECTGYAMGSNAAPSEPCSDAFVARFNPGGGLTYSTYLGGTDMDTGWSVALDPQDNAYVAGTTSSLDFPLLHPLPQNGGNLAGTGFVTKLSPDGQHLLYSTYFGGAGFNPATETPTPIPVATDDGGDSGDTGPNTAAESTDVYAIAVDGEGHAYVTGDTNSTSFPVVSALQSSLGSDGNDSYVAELAASGDHLIYSTYLGGNGWDAGAGIAVDAGENVFVVGSTESTNFPVTGSLKEAPTATEDCADPDSGEETGVCSDVFVTRIGLGGRPLVYSTYLGGSSVDEGDSIALDSSGDAYVAGQSFSPDLPTLTPLPGTSDASTSDSGDTDITVTGFVLKVYDTLSATLTPTPSPTATSTPTPTHTPVPKRAKRQSRCKKGYQLVHGACKKRKKHTG